MSDMWKEPFDVQVLEKHEDPRGQLFEILRFDDQDVPGNGQLYTFTIEPGKRRGDHFHQKKREWFTCVHGKAKILLKTKDGRKESLELSSEAPSVVYAGPYTVHALLNEENSTAVIVSYGSKQHDPDDPDTFFETAD